MPKARCCTSGLSKAGPNTIRRAHAVQPVTAVQSEYSLQHSQAVVDLLATIACRHDATSGQVALAWLLAQKPWMPIPGTRKLHRLEENLRAAGLTLTADELAEIETTAAAIEIHGGRSPKPPKP